MSRARKFSPSVLALPLALLSAVAAMGISSSAQAQQRSIINPSFEDDNIPAAAANADSSETGSGVYFINQQHISGWNTTETGAGGPANIPSGPIIEVWQTVNSSSGPAASNGNYYVEMNYLNSAALYQEVCMTNGESVGWTFDHHWRNGGDANQIANLEIAELDGTLIQTLDSSTVTAATSGWATNADGGTPATYTGTTGIKRIQFRSANSGGTGNFLDNIEIDFAVYVELNANATSVNEGETVGLPALVISGKLDAEVTFPIIVGAGSTASATDYTMTATSITVPAGNYNGQEFTLPFEVTRDTEAEGNETVVLEIGTPTGPGAGEIVIADIQCVGAPDTTVTHTILDKQTADLETTYAVNATTPIVGETLTFTTTVTNTNATGLPTQHTATNVTAAVNVPTGLTNVGSYMPSKGSITGGVWTIGSLAPGETVTLTYTGDVNGAPGSSHSNFAEVSASDAFDPDSTPNNFGTDPAEDDGSEVSFTVSNLTTVSTAPSLCVNRSGTLLGPNIMTAYDNGTFGSGSGAANQVANPNPYAPIAGYIFSSDNNIAAAGDYAYISNPTSFAGWPSSAHALTDPDNGVTGRSLFINGSPSAGTFFSQTLTGLSLNTNYELSMWTAEIFSNVAGQADTAILSFKVNGVEYYNTGPGIRYANPTWTRGGFVFNSGGSTTATVTVELANPDANGRDFAIDNVTARACQLPNGTVEGVVFTDNLPQNDTNDAVEDKLGAIKVQLIDTQGDADASNDIIVAETDSAATTGAYSFTNVPLSANYIVRVDASDPDLPAAVTGLGTPNDLPVNLATNGQTVSDQNFGFDAPPAVLTCPVPNQSSAVSAVHWINFGSTTYTGSTNLNVTLPDGRTPTLTITKISGSVNLRGAPALGNFALDDLANGKSNLGSVRPMLYHTANASAGNPSTATYRITSTIPLDWVSADGEATSQLESLSVTTDGGVWEGIDSIRASDYVLSGGETATWTMTGTNVNTFGTPVLVSRGASQMDFTVISTPASFGRSGMAFGVLMPDFGDAPSSYGTASHKVSNVNAACTTFGNDTHWLGSVKPDGDTPSITAGATATGDNTGTGAGARADEDGVTIPTLAQGVAASITATVSGTGGFLQGWIDWDGNGTFDGGEQVAVNLQDDGTGGDATAGDGTITFSVTPPLTAVTTQTYARFRWSTTSGLDSTTAASNGEVEDYAVTVVPGPTISTGALSYSIPTATGVNHGSTAMLDWSGTSLAATPGAGNGTLNNGDIVNFPLGGCHAGTLTATFSNVTNAGNFDIRDMNTWSGSTAWKAYNGAGGGEAIHTSADDLGFTIDWSLTINGVSRAPDIFFIDAESTHPTSESITAVTNGGAWSLTENLGNANYSVTGIGSQTVVINDTYEGGIAYGSPLLLSEGTTRTTTSIVAGGNQAIAFGLLLPCDYGDAPASYGAPSHSYRETDNPSGLGLVPLAPAHYLGADVDAESTAQPTANAQGDDGDVQGDDEDGVTIPALTQGGPATITTTVTGAGGFLQGWIDWNGDGVFGAGEQVATDLQDNGTGGDATANDGTITFSVTPPATTVASTFARFRWSTTSGLDSTTVASDGEVEDYAVTVNQLDLSDAPTTFGDATHTIIPGIQLGAAVDADPASIAGPNADGDGTDDDGVVVPALERGTVVSIPVTVSGAGFLQGWIDWNQNGIFDVPTEQIATDVQDTGGAGSITLAVSVPADAVPGQTIARFRWSSNFTLGSTGPASDGEVEDYQVTIIDTSPMLSGTLFLDNGVGGVTAHDGLIGGTEMRAALGTITITDGGGTQIATATVNPDGTWEAMLPVGYAGPVTVATTPLPTYRTISEDVSSLPAPTNPDTADGTYSFTAAAGVSYSGLNIGLIAEPTLTQDQSASVSPGQVIDLPHVYTATTSGTVSFALVDQVAAPAGGFSAAIYADADCDGVADGVLPASTAVTAGQQICLAVRTQAGAGISPAASYTYGIEATTAYAGTAVAGVARNDDALGSSGSGEDLLLRKLVTNVTKGSTEGVSNTGDIGDVLQYRIVMTNPGPGPASNMTVSDKTPAYTSLSGPIPSPVTVAPGVTCTVVTPAANTAGYAGPLEWSCPGSMPSGATGSLTFQVTISP